MKLAIAAILATSAAAFAPAAQSGRSATTQLHETKVRSLSYFLAVRNLKQTFRAGF